MQQAPSKPTLLIVDDDEEIRTQMKWALAADHHVVTAVDRSAALEAFRSSLPPVVIFDLALPPNPAPPDEERATLSELLAIDLQTKVVILSGQGEKEVTLRAIGAGAYAFLVTPVDIDLLKVIRKRAFHGAELEREYRQMQQRLQADG